eukprot:3233087-Amphidinium_carterae.1
MDMIRARTSSATQPRGCSSIDMNANVALSSCASLTLSHFVFAMSFRHVQCGRMKIVADDAEYLVETFLPGLSVPHGGRSLLRHATKNVAVELIDIGRTTLAGLSAVATVVVALLWFAIFLNKFYHEDREDNLSASASL